MHTLSKIRPILPRSPMANVVRETSGNDGVASSAAAHIPPPPVSRIRSLRKKKEPKNRPGKDPATHRPSKLRNDGLSNRISPHAEAAAAKGRLKNHARRTPARYKHDHIVFPYTIPRKNNESDECGLPLPRRSEETSNGNDGRGMPLRYTLTWGPSPNRRYVSCAPRRYIIRPKIRRPSAWRSTMLPR